MKRRAGQFSDIEAQAARWLVRRDRGFSAGEHSDFERWRAADPRHAAAWDEINAVWNVFDRPARTGRLDPLRAELSALEFRGWSRWRAAGLAGALAAACVAIAIAVRGPPEHGATATAVVVERGRAQVTEPQRQVLSDGSLVEFSPGTEISVAFEAAARVVVLHKGEAHFSVVKNPAAPFMVTAGTVTVRAVGTAFAVQYGSAEIEVLVTEGTVRVATLPADHGSALESASAAARSSVAEQAPVVAAGQRALVPLGSQGQAPRVDPLSASELKERLSWRLRRLDFSETTIAEAIRMFERYSDVALRAGDEAVAAMRITGVFRCDNVEGFVRALQTTLGIQVDRGDDGRIVLRAGR